MTTENGIFGGKILWSLVIGVKTDSLEVSLFSYNLYFQ